MKKLLFLIAVVGLVVGFLVTSVLLMPPTPEPASPATAHTLTSPAVTASAAVEEMLQATVIFEVYKIPIEYYNQPCQKPAHLTFYDWMATLELPPYEVNAFDCSQMAAYVEWLSENCNHRATIAGASFEGYGHLWVLIDIGGVPFAYEPPRYQGRHWVARDGGGSTHFHYNPDTEWESIYEAPWAHSRFEEEFAWWLIYPELWGGT